MRVNEEKIFAELTQAYSLFSSPCDVSLSAVAARCPSGLRSIQAWLRNFDNVQRLAKALGFESGVYHRSYYNRSHAGRFGRLGGAHRGESGHVLADVQFFSK